VLRFLTALVLLAADSFADPQLNPPPPEIAPPQIPKVEGPSVVAYAQNPAAVLHDEENPAVTRSMVDAVVRTLSGKADTTEAWRTIVSPGDRVGIKVCSSGGPMFCTRRGVVLAVIAGLRSAGVKNIIVWDRNAATMRSVGFTSEALGCEVRAIDPPKGWDRDTFISSPVMGRVIWGDLLFAGIARDRFADQMSPKSHLPTLLTRDLDKFINIAALSDDPGCGISGAVHSAVIDNLDNWRRFTGDGAMLLPDCYADARLGGKCALHILDALNVTYAGGPAANPYHSSELCTLYASRDPIALDATALRMLEKWRSADRLGPIGPKAAWLGDATIGHADEKMIQYRPAR
jgi:hypothetical protein